jgi:hypothetical protein
MSIYRAKALEYYHYRRQADVAVEPFSGWLIVTLWSLVALLVLGGAALFIELNRSLPHV